LTSVTRIPLHVLVITTVAATSWLVSTAAAQDADSRVLGGRIRCDAIPGMTRIPLNQPFEIRLSGKQARYTRKVRRPDTSEDSGYVESGSGTVSDDGMLVLQGRAEGRGFQYTAAYEGRVDPAGAMRLTGVQHWSGTSFRSFDRSCTIELRP